MFKTARMQKFQAIVLQSHRDEVVSRLHDAGIVQLKEVAQSELVRKTLGDEFFEVTTLLAKLNKIQSVLGAPALKRPLKVKERTREQLIKAAKKTLEKLEPVLNVLEARHKEIEAERQKLLAQKEVLKDFLEVKFPLQYLRSTDEFYVIVGRISKERVKGFTEAAREALSQKVIVEILGRGEKRAVIVACRARDQPKLAPVLYRYEIELLELPPMSVVPQKALKQLDRQLPSLERQKTNIEKDIAKLAKTWALDIGRLAEELEIIRERTEACSTFGYTEAAVVIEGWVPAKKTAKLESLVTAAAKNRCIFDIHEVRKDEIDQAPTQLENPPVVKDFEFITNMYGVPRYDEVDPTPFLAVSFAIFFGICLSDIGYGAVLAGVMLSGFWIAKAFPPNIRRMLAISGVVAIVMGILTGSLFGPTLPAIWSDPTKNPLPLLKLAIIIGVLHLFIAFGVVKAIKDVIRRNWSKIIFEDVARAMLVIGFFGLGFSILGLSLNSFGIDFTFPKMELASAFNPLAPATAVVVVLRILFYLGLFIGIIGVVITSSGVRAKFSGAINSVYGIIGYIADVTSYSRLMALGVATGVIAYLLNYILWLAFTGMVRPYLGFSPAVIFAIFVLIGIVFVFLIGHSFNIFIGSMGGFIHTMRLHFAEFFGKFYEGGGEKFAPFKVKRVVTEVEGGELPGS